jgi:UDP-N-acetylmuramoyl-L-alanyl-D-glutamate--2,6-diaminopimelate ligase
VIVDYAHTPDGIRRLLEAARAITDARSGARLRAVFGAVGVPDPDKAAGCGSMVRALADHVVFTTGSAPGGPRVPRLLELVRADGAGAELELALDRRKAIRRAVEAARPGDVVAVLGLGALGRQTLDARGTSTPLDDRLVAREAVRAVTGS